MLAKLNDNVAALVLGIYLLGILLYVVQLLFMTEIWLKGEEVDISAMTVARVLGSAWLGLGLGVVLTFLNGPDGQKTFFTTLLVAQVATLFWGFSGPCRHTCSPCLLQRMDCSIASRMRPGSRCFPPRVLTQSLGLVHRPIVPSTGPTSCRRRRDLMLMVWSRFMALSLKTFWVSWQM